MYETYCGSSVGSKSKPLEWMVPEAGQGGRAALSKETWGTSPDPEKLIFLIRDVDRAVWRARFFLTKGTNLREPKGP